LFENRYDFILDKIIETEQMQIKPFCQCSLSTDYCVCTHVSQLIDVISVLIVQTKNSDKKFWPAKEVIILRGEVKQATSTKNIILNFQTFKAKSQSF
jgi:hypothetical protein